MNCRTAFATLCRTRSTSSPALTLTGDRCPRSAAIAAACCRGRAITSHHKPRRGHRWLRPGTAVLPRHVRGAGKASITGAGSSGVVAAVSSVFPIGGREERPALSVSLCLCL
jgi:hypothetical protein